MKKKIKKFFKNTHIFNPKKWSIATQLLGIFALLFGLYYILQTLISNIIFSDYFKQKQTSVYKKQIMELKQMLESPDDFYDFALDFYLNSKVYSIILDENFDMVKTDDFDYTIKINDISYKLSSSNINYYMEKDHVRIYYKKNEIENANIVCQVNNYTSGKSQTISSCGDNYLESEGYISSIIKPNNLNNYFKTDANIITEYDLIQSQKKENLEYFEKYDYKIYDNDFQNEIKTNLIFINKIQLEEQTYYIVNVAPIPLVSDILSTVITYNTYIFAFILIIISIVYIYLIKLISNPIMELSEITLDISKMNFRPNLIRNSNKETYILTESINKLSVNLSKSIQILKDKNEKIKAEAELKNQIVSSLSHEMKTPLFIIQATISAILDGLFDEKTTKLELENVQNEIQKASTMIEELVRIYKNDSSNEELNIELFSLNDLAKQILKDFAPNIKSSKLDVLYEESNHFNILSDKKQMTSVLNNLILNAIKYTPDGNRIEVKLNETSKFIIISIINYGVTIPEDELTKIFEPFYRIDKTGKKGIKTEGNGLGLFIVKQILNRLQIKYEAISKNNYVCFNLYYNKLSHVTNGMNED